MGKIQVNDPIRPRELRPLIGGFIVEHLTWRGFFTSIFLLA